MILRRRAAASAAVDAAHPNPALQTVKVKGSWGLRWVSQGVHKEAQVETPITIEQARSDYNQAKQNLFNARTGTRSSLSIAQQELSDKKELLLHLLESTINTELNEKAKSDLVYELNQLKSSN